MSSSVSNFYMFRFSLRDFSLVYSAVGGGSITEDTNCYFLKLEYVVSYVPMTLHWMSAKETSNIFVKIMMLLLSPNLFLYVFFDLYYFLLILTNFLPHINNKSD